LPSALYAVNSTVGHAKAEQTVHSPSVSVLIPTYNYARFIGEAVESVLAQDFRDFELLILDDCSTDNTAEVARPFCARDPRVRFTANSKNLGMVNNWNHCLNQAQGRYIKFIFGDDKLCDPQALGKMIALLERHPSATLAASARTILDEDSKAVDFWRTLKNGCHNGRKVIVSCLVENKNLVGEPSAVLFRKKDAQRGFDPKLRQIVDLEMWFHLLENGNLAYTREPLCGFRVHGRQQTTVNHSAGVALKEHSDFITNYTLAHPLPPKIFFSQLVGLRRLLRKHPDAVTPEILAREKHLSACISKGWYAYYWLGYKAAKPFRNLGNSIRKRVNRAQAVLQR
jgi:glycosyltransferase involved in cell wall biosynthesis